MCIFILFCYGWSEWNELNLFIGWVDVCFNV